MKKQFILGLCLAAALVFVGCGEKTKTEPSNVGDSAQSSLPAQMQEQNDTQAPSEVKEYSSMGTRTAKLEVKSGWYEVNSSVGVYLSTEEEPHGVILFCCDLLSEKKGAPVTEMYPDLEIGIKSVIAHAITMATPELVLEKQEETTLNGQPAVWVEGKAVCESDPVSYSYYGYVYDSQVYFDDKACPACAILAMPDSGDNSGRLADLKEMLSTIQPNE